MPRLSHRLLIALAPPSAREWIEAMLREAQEEASPRNRAGWYLAAAQVVFVSRIRHWALPLKASGLALVMLAVDWTSGAFLPALALIFLSAGLLARESVRRSGGALFVAAGTLPLAHVIANWVPVLRPHYQYRSLDLTDWALLSAVAGIGICAVRIAAAFRLVRELAKADR